MLAVPEFVVACQLPAKITTSHKYWFIPKDWTFFLFVCAYVLYTITCSIWGYGDMGRGSARPHIYIYIQRERDIYIERERVYIYIYIFVFHRERGVFEIAILFLLQ